jgi:hypothetical protein
MRYVNEKLRDPITYLIAVVVGTLINAYGHLLVPLLRGEPHPVEALGAEFGTHPMLVTFSVLLAYAFPFAVSIVSAVLTRRSLRRLESWAAFPNQKPDPVFRADRDGHLVEMGEVTRALFTRHSIRTAQDVLGEELWQSLRGAPVGVRAELFYSQRLAGWYLVRHAPAESGLVNVYLTETRSPDDGPPH